MAMATSKGLTELVMRRLSATLKYLITNGASSSQVEIKLLTNKFGDYIANGFLQMASSEGVAQNPNEVKLNNACAQAFREAFNLEASDSNITPDKYKATILGLMVREIKHISREAFLTEFDSYVTQSDTSESEFEATYISQS